MWMEDDDKACLFQHTAARRRLQTMGVINKIYEYVSTHSRPKAAAIYDQDEADRIVVSTHSREKAAAY